jgi:hypothetical protein
MLRIGRDLLDQQIIDVTGRKVVRVTDVTMEIHHDGGRDTLHGSGSGHRPPQHFPPPAAGRLVPPAGSAGCSEPIPPNSIRWELCNVVEPTRCGGCG